MPPSDSLSFVEDLYLEYERNPASVDAEWQRYFASLQQQNEVANTRLGPSFRPRSLFHPRPASTVSIPQKEEERSIARLQERVDQLIRNYRVLGHAIAKLDPLDRPRNCPAELDPAFYHFTAADMEKTVSSEVFQYTGKLTLKELLQRLRNTYCRSIGVQYMHIDDLSIRRWLQKRMEGTENRLDLTREAQLRIFTRLTDAVTFEEFIHKKFIGAKSFSLEGSESLIPLLDLAIEKAAAQGTTEIVMGMAHRGRLNVLANILGKSPRKIFREFADADPDLYLGRGDVKYHLGHSNDWVTSQGKKIHLSLCFNPSHLEFVNTVVLGRARAKQDRSKDLDQRRCMALLIHGDASFAGEGAVQETLNLSQLKGYKVGGTLHVVVNNQIGFTTGPEEGRSSTYATDLAKMIEIPIFHVNGEDPEAVAQVVELAMDFRQTFQRDVVIDMYGYRRLGHNEADEPSFTQPLMYRAIEKRKPVREGYLDHLLTLKGISREEADQISERRRQHLEQELSESRRDDTRPRGEGMRGLWKHYVGGPDAAVPEVETGVSVVKLQELLEKQTQLPADFTAHPKIVRLLENRREMAKGKIALDWSTAESLAFATLVEAGTRVRLSGQDSGRGTFSQRHAILYDHQNGTAHVPLQHLLPTQASFEVFNSPLSEIGVLGFDYGYSLDTPDGLVLWEAQFGDFVNTAQVIVDQFISSAEEKWQRLSGVVMLLPHGFEGQGPEHSSARLERFLALGARDNIQVVYPSTPSQYFHCLRRQIVRPWRKPLVIMTPKSLLRHPGAVSSLESLASGTFQRVLADTEVAPKETRRILLCSGKVYYELLKLRGDLKRQDVAIVRMEQLYPIPVGQLEIALAEYATGTAVYWVQEEPENMGAWRFLKTQFGTELFGRFPLTGRSRPASASPATGSAQSHKIEQQTLLNEAFVP